MDNLQTDTYKKIHFAVMAIEASAKKARLSGKEMHDRLKRQGLIHKRLLRHYEQLHTQSVDWVADDTIETFLFYQDLPAIVSSRVWTAAYERPVYC